MAIQSPEARERQRVQQREHKRLLYQADPEKYKARVRGRRADNPELLAAQSRERYAANPEKYRQGKRDHRARHPEASRAGVRHWKDGHAAQAWAIQQRARGAPATPEAIAYVEQIWNDPCAYCGTTAGRMTIDHVVPIARGGQSLPENLARACRRCNDRKHDESLFRFLGYLGLPAKRDRLRGG